MKTMTLYEPAMCCETGLCGVSADPELLRVSTAVNALRKNGVSVRRFNLSGAPAEFAESPVICELLNARGVDALPAVLVDDALVLSGRYPTNAEFAALLEVPASFLTVVKLTKKPHGG